MWGNPEPESVPRRVEQWPLRTLCQRNLFFPFSFSLRWQASQKWEHAARNDSGMFPHQRPTALEKNISYRGELAEDANGCAASGRSLAPRSHVFNREVKLHNTAASSLSEAFQQTRTLKRSDTRSYSMDAWLQGVYSLPGFYVVPFCFSMWCSYAHSVVEASTRLVFFQGTLNQFWHPFWLSAGRGFEWKLVQLRRGKHSWGRGEGVMFGKVEIWTNTSASSNGLLMLLTPVTGQATLS